MSSWEFSVPGTPVPMPRPRWSLSPRFRKAVGARSWGSVIQMVSQPGSVVHQHVPGTKLRPYQKAIKTVAKQAGMTPSSKHEPVRLDVYAVFPRPVQRPSWCPKAVWSSGRPFTKVTRCDADNVYKSVADALEGVAYGDDACVVRGEFAKLMAGVDEPAHTTIIVTHLNQEQMIGY